MPDEMSSVNVDLWSAGGNGRNSDGDAGAATSFSNSLRPLHSGCASPSGAVNAEAMLLKLVGVFRREP